MLYCGLTARLIASNIVNLFLNRLPDVLGPLLLFTIRHQVTKHMAVFTFQRFLLIANWHSDNHALIIDEVDEIRK